MRNNGRMRRAVSVLFIAFLTASCGGDPGTPDGSPSPTDVQDVPDPFAGVERLPSAECCLGTSLPAGRYRSPATFGLDFVLLVEDGWGLVNTDAERLLSLTRGENAIGHATHWLGFFRVPNAPAPADVIDQVIAMPMTESEAPADVQLAGVPGVTVELAALPNPDQPASSKIVEGAIAVPVLDAIVPGFYYTESAEARMRFTVLDVTGTTLLIYTEAPKEEFEAFVELVEPIVATMVFGAA